MGGDVPAVIIGCILPYPIHEHSANEIETHFIKRLISYLYLTTYSILLGGGRDSK